jgi:hypothetical protein
MVTGDRVYLENNGSIEWMAIADNGTLQAEGDYMYRITRNLDGSGANDWFAGDAVLNTGTTGDGYIDIYSDHSIRGATQYGPSIVGNIRTGTTYSNLIEGWAVGNLNGLYGYGVDIYGAAFGKYVNSSSFLTIDPTNGIRMIYKNNLGANLTVAQWDISGHLTIGEVGASKDNVYISAGALAIRNNTTERIGLTAAGILTIKDSGGDAVFTFDASAGAEFTKPLTLASTGGIYQGTGTFASPTTGLKIYNSSGVGMIAGYNGGTVQWYGNTDGKLYAGAGSVVMNGNGIEITVPDSTLPTVSGSYKFYHDSTLFADFYGIHNTSGSFHAAGIEMPLFNGINRALKLDCVADASHTANITLTAIFGSTWASIDLSATGTTTLNNSDLRLSNGLYVGTTVTTPEPGRIYTAYVETLAAAQSDDYAASLRLAPGYTGAYTVTRHNYITLVDVTVAGSAVVTNAAAIYFNAAIGTHKAIDSGTTKTSPGTVTAWMKVNLNGVIHYIPCYASKTS